MLLKRKGAVKRSLMTANSEEMENVEENIISLREVHETSL